MNRHPSIILIKPIVCITLSIVALGCGKDGSTAVPGAEASSASTAAPSVSATTILAPVEAAPAEPPQAAEAPRTPSILAQTGATRYAVFNVVKGDFLKLRALPDGKSDELTTLKPDARNVRLTGNWERSSQTTWVQVKTDVGDGWTNRYYLTEQTSTACGAPNLDALLERFAKALREKDGTELAKLTPPGRGLILTGTNANFSVRYRQDEIETLFESKESKKWWFGEQGKSSNGTFVYFAQPRLNLAMMMLSKKRCADPATEARVPAHLRGLVNYALPQMPSLQVPPWVIGVEFVAGKPYVGLLVEM